MQNLLGTSTASKLDKLIPFVSISTFVLFDIHWAGFGRPVDYIFLLVFLLWLFYSKLEIPIGPAFIACFWMSPWLAYGAIMGHFLECAAFACGIFTFFGIRAALRHAGQKQIFYELSGLAILIIVGVQFVQLIIFLVSDWYLDVTSLLGAPSGRIYHPLLNYFRPSSFFQEPNSLSVALFALLSVRLIHEPAKEPSFRRSLVYLVGFLGLLISFSLWGIIVSLLFLDKLITSLRSINQKYRIAKMVFYLAGISLAIFQYDTVAHTVVRFSQILDFSDPSAFDRYVPTGSNIPTFNIIFGHGVDTKGFQKVYGANSIAFFVYSFGIGGFIFLLLSFFSYFSVSLRAFISIVALNTTFPAVTCLFLWIFIALMVSEKEGF